MDQATKQRLLSLIDEAVAGGWEHRRACQYLELEEGRAWRWRRRREVDCLEDERAGGNPVHGLRPMEVTAILELFETWGWVDRIASSRTAAPTPAWCSCPLRRFCGWR